MGKDKKEKSRKSFGILAAVVIILLLVTGGILVYQQVLSSSLNNIRYVSDSDYEVGNSRYACDGKWRVSKYKFYETDMYILNVSRTPNRNGKNTKIKRSQSVSGKNFRRQTRTASSEAP